MIGLSLISTGYATAVAAAGSLVQEFELAQQAVQPLSVGPQDQLKLYGWFKQATLGDVQGKRPGMFDIRGRAKYDAWAAVRGLTCDQAMKSYVDFVRELLAPES